MNASMLVDGHRAALRDRGFGAMECIVHLSSFTRGCRRTRHVRLGRARRNNTRRGRAGLDVHYPLRLACTRSPPALQYFSSVPPTLAPTAPALEWAPNP